MVMPNLTVKNDTKRKLMIKVVATVKCIEDVDGFSVYNVDFYDCEPSSINIVIGEIPGS